MRYISYEDRHRTYLYGKLDRFTNKAAHILRDEIVQTMENAAPSGKIYASRTGEGTHQASAPGEPPAIDTGEYVRSWKVGKAVHRRTRRSAVVFSDLRVGKRGWLLALLLEHGTTTMLPRPHIRVALDNVRRELRELLKKTR
jgi:hypothetical protein